MPASLPDNRRLTRALALLETRYGDETWHWAPDYVRGPADVMFGAVLVQHTTWTNAERALESLRGACGLDFAALLAMPVERLEALIRVAGTPTVKARRLKALAVTVQDRGGILALLKLPDAELRACLLETHGIGPESADAIMLYAAGRRSFVVDAYAQRLFGRLGLGPASRDYETWRAWFESEMFEHDAGSFQRIHAWIVLHGKDVCRPRPACHSCVLRGDVCDGVTNA